MHLFRIEIYLRNEASGLTATAPDLVLYAEDHEQARTLYNEYKKQRHESNNQVKYTVKLAVLSYKTLEDPSAFLNQFEA